MRKLLLPGLLLAAAIFGAPEADAAATVQTTLSNSAFTDLGTAPLQVQALNAGIVVVIADSLPSAHTLGSSPRIGDIVIYPAADASSHVYAIGLTAFSAIAYTPVYSDWPISAVTQGTSPWLDNITEFGGAAFALGQQLAAASLPVVLPAAQIATLTPPSAITIGGYSFYHVPAAAAANYSIKTSAGVLHSITFNSAATATNVTTICDGDGACTTTVAIPNAVSVTAPVTTIYDIAFSAGLYITIGTAAGGDMTVAYK